MFFTAHIFAYKQCALDMLAYTHRPMVYGTLRPSYKACWTKEVPLSCFVGMNVLAAG